MFEHRADAGGRLLTLSVAVRVAEADVGLAGQVVEKPRDHVTEVCGLPHDAGPAARAIGRQCVPDAVDVDLGSIDVPVVEGTSEGAIRRRRHPSPATRIRRR